MRTVGLSLRPPEEASSNEQDEDVEDAVAQLLKVSL